ncbi:hypothetical protein NC652_030833 [Populus alba x Populus x berolinensis]|nr:hypothetical protein NC652_030833 [Populus alba x Populus x berolinensis]
MAGICSLNPTTLMTFKRIHGIRFFSGATDNENKSQTITKTPPILKLAVSGVTELLRVFCFSGKERYLPYYSPSSIAFSGCLLGRCPETNKKKQNPLPKLLLLNVVLRGTRPKSMNLEGLCAKRGIFLIILILRLRFLRVSWEDVRKQTK